jgi:hypothetical protein
MLAALKCGLKSALGLGLGFHAKEKDYTQLTCSKYCRIGSWRASRCVPPPVQVMACPDRE